MPTKFSSFGIDKMTGYPPVVISKYVGKKYGIFFYNKKKYGIYIH